MYASWRPTRYYTAAAVYIVTKMNGKYNSILRCRQQLWATTFIYFSNFAALDNISCFNLEQYFALSCTIQNYRLVLDTSI